MNIQARRNRKLKAIPSELWEHFYRSFPIPIFVEDARRVLEFMDRLRAEGVTDMGAWLDANPGFFIKTWSLIEILDVNDHAVQRSGARDAQELVKSLDRMMLPETLPALRGILIDLFERKPFHISECQYRTLDGQIRHSINQALLPGDGKDHTLVFFTQSDITDFKLAELDLRHSQEHYCSLVENAQDVILCHDLAGNVTYMNQAGLELTGWSREAVVGEDLGKLLPDLTPSGSRRRSLTHLGQVGGRTLLRNEHGVPVGGKDRGGGEIIRPAGAGRPRRTAVVAGSDPRHHRPAGGRAQAAAAGGPAQEHPEDGKPGRPGGRHRPRLQQPAGDHHGQHRAVDGRAVGTRRNAWWLAAGHAGGHPGGRSVPPDAGPTPVSPWPGPRPRPCPTWWAT